MLRRIISLYPRAVEMYVDEANAVQYVHSPLADKFTFDIGADRLILYSRDAETFVDAAIEMAMYLAGFTTMLGNDEAWVIEFTIGAWKPVKRTVKRQLGIPYREKTRGIVGLPPPSEKAIAEPPYPFRTLVSNYDYVSFHQMVMLAARDDITVYFPPETHHKVLAVYVYMRRAIQEVAQNLGIDNHVRFNTNLVNEIHRLDQLFRPSDLPLPGWFNELGQAGDDFHNNAANRPGLFSGAKTPDRSSDHNPFEEFVKQLFSDEDESDRNDN
jgi:hypothetical protein